MNALMPAAPILVVALGALLLMLAEAFGAPAKAVPAGSDLSVDPTAGRSGELAAVASVVLFAGAIASLALWWAGVADVTSTALAPYLVMDRFSLFFCFTLCVGGGLAALLAGGYLPEHGLDRGEFFPLILFSTVGAMALAAAGDLLTLFVALETMSLGVYCMIGLRRGSTRASEAALKYFLLGSFAAALMLFGGALLYGATGHTDLAGIGTSLRTMVGAPGGGTALAIAGIVLMLVGLAFKVSAVPFHMWTPDAYEGAPTPTTSYMAVAVKSAAFAVLLRVVLTSFGGAELTSWGSGWPPVLAVLAILSMTVANLVAGRQASVKRMLAYSSIAHAGYALVGIVAAANKPELASSVLYYMLAYTVSTVGAFGALVLCGSRGAEAVSYADLAGLGKRHPPAALAFSLFLLSLAGSPPTAGFFGKLYVFSAAMDAAPENPILYYLVVAGLLNSVIGAYYYLRVLVFMYMREPEPGAPVAKPMHSGYVGFAIAVAAILVLLLGLLPGSSLDIARAATLAGP
ncbi:MAG TPA: NADH-quinone oxidoreductase subunit N [Polyangiaceae bacterium]|nr:NADH-quinone oxidoreductase subunit N [Polyangiaceae bacterium]